MNAFAPEDLIKGGSELGVAITKQEAAPKLAVLELPGQVTSLLDHPLAGRVRGDPSEVNPATADLDEEEDVEAGQPDGLDGEEVGGQDRVSVLADEVGPGAVAATRSRWDPPTAEDLGDTHVRDAEAQLEKFSLDSSVAPARVLLRQPEDELAKLGIALAPTWWALPIGGPFAANQVAVPSEQSFRRGEEGGASSSAHEPAEGGEEQPISGLPTRPPGLALKDAELMAEGQDLGPESSVGAETDE